MLLNEARVLGVLLWRTKKKIEMQKIVNEIKMVKIKQRRRSELKRERNLITGKAGS